MSRVVSVIVSVGVLLVLFPAVASADVDVVFDDAAAEAVLAIADAQAAGRRVEDAAWAALFASDGYRDLKAREEAMGRAFSDEEFRAFVLSPAVLDRRSELRAALEEWKRFDMARAAERALAYLPKGARIEAVVYPLIKPKPNSFVFSTARGRKAIFLYLDPAMSGAKFENVVVHEMHHIGFATICESTEAATPVAKARRWAGGFGEGVAMLAAAGSAEVHPHATSGEEERGVWERDVKKVAADMRRLERFFLDVAEERLQEEEVRKAFMSFISAGDVPQGAFYTVGWHMASTIERAAGRDALLAVLCEAGELMALYDEVAGEGEPKWSEEVVDLLAPDASRRVRSYEIDAEFVPERASIEGRARIAMETPGRVRPSLRFFLHGELRAERVAVDGVGVEVQQEPIFYPWDYSLVANRITIPLPRSRTPESIEIAWSGKFHPSAARSPSDYMRIDRDGVHLRSAGYSLWFPVTLRPGDELHAVDFPKVTIRVPEPFRAVFAGERLHRSSDGEWEESRWRADDLEIFEAQMTARRFKVQQEGEVFVYSLEDEESIEAASEIASFASKLVALFRERYDRRAVGGQLHVVELPKYGDIASGNVIGMQESVWKAFGSESRAQITLAHELVHPFVRPKVSGSDPLYALVVEGFPSYFHYAVLAEVVPDFSYEETMAATRSSYEKKRREGRDRWGRALPPEKPLTAIGPEEIGEYKDRFILADRAILFLDDLRQRMGEEAFVRFCRELFALPELTFESFRDRVVSDVPGYGPAFDSWLTTSDEPPAFEQRAPVVGGER